MLLQIKNKRKIIVILRYDFKNKFYVVSRKTPKTYWEDRYRNINEAKRRYTEFLCLKNKQLENKLLLSIR